MNIRKILLASLTVMLVATGNVWAGKNEYSQPHTGYYKFDGSRFHDYNFDRSNFHGDCFKAPEIDAASGTSAIALLVGALLLVGEKSRSRNS